MDLEALKKSQQGYMHIELNRQGGEITMRGTMRKITLLASGVMVALLAISSTAFADQNTVNISGGGTVVNGYYSQPVTITFQELPTSGSGANSPSGSCTMGTNWQNVTYSFDEDGTHTFTLLRNSNNVNFIEVDSQAPQVFDGGTFASPTGMLDNPTEYPACNYLSSPTPTNTVYTTTLKMDLNSPTINITAPTNNTDVSSSTSTATISGTVGDTGSGINTVSINGVSAKVNGSTFSASVPLNYGLNTVTATATSNTNKTATSQVAVFRYESASSGSGTVNTTTPQTTPNQPASSNPDKNSTNATGNNDTSSKPNSNTQVSTPVKVAGGAGAVGAAGVGVASYLGYIPYKKIGLFVAKVVSK